MPLTQKGVPTLVPTAPLQFGFSMRVSPTRKLCKCIVQETQLSAVPRSHNQVQSIANRGKPMEMVETAEKNMDRIHGTWQFPHSQGPWVPQLPKRGWSWCRCPSSQCTSQRLSEQSDGKSTNVWGFPRVSVSNLAIFQFPHGFPMVFLSFPMIFHCRVWFSQWHQCSSRLLQAHLNSARLKAMVLAMITTAIDPPNLQSRHVRLVILPGQVAIAEMSAPTLFLSLSSLKLKHV